MRLLQTHIDIAASAQTVWAVFDELRSYPEWNRMLPDLSGLTTVGSTLTSDFVRPNTPTMRIEPKIVRIVAARELRWQSQTPDPAVFSAEHVFRIEPKGPNGCSFHNDEAFSGFAIEELWPGLDTDTRQAFDEVNLALKTRAEACAAAEVALHPCLGAEGAAVQSLAGATLRCACSDKPVEVRLTDDIAHNHLCGCSQCWKPAGHLLAQTAVVPAGRLEVIAHGDKLQPVDARAAVKRHACQACGVHLFGRVDDERHHFYGLDFVHPERAVGVSPPAPAFAGFVSSIIETGTSPTLMSAVRARLQRSGVPAYDAFSPELMDAIAWHRVKLAAHPAA